jgi:phosphomannomutase
MQLEKLKSGTDIRGTAISEKTSPDLTPAIVALLARTFYKTSGAKTIAIGRDCRLSGEVLYAAATEALVAEGATVLSCGMTSTPAIFMTTKLSGADAAIMLTASHHPKDKNGMKFFLPSGGISSAYLSEIIFEASQIEEAEQDIVHKTEQGKAEQAEQCKAEQTEQGIVHNTQQGKAQQTQRVKGHCGTIIEKDFLGEYCHNLQSYFKEQLCSEQPLSGLKIAVDAGGGSAGFYAERILQPLGADISSSQYLQADGNFPFHAPNPEDKEALCSISNRVKETESEMGIIFDTDGDRSAIILQGGEVLSRNRLIAALSAVVLSHEKGGIIVTDSVTSEGLSQFISLKGGVHIRYKRGYQNVISFAKSLCKEGKNAPLAAETSGHIALRENYFLDDGAFAAAFLIVEEIKQRRKGGSLLTLIKELVEPLEEVSLRLDITCTDFQREGEAVLQRIKSSFAEKDIAKDSYEGVRVYLEGGFFMARLSVHDPVIPINIESDKEGGAKIIAKILFDAIKEEKQLDLQRLREYIGQ